MLCKNILQKTIVIVPYSKLCSMNTMYADVNSVDVVFHELINYILFFFKKKMMQN